MPTRRFSDLSQQEQIDVIDEFLGSSKGVEFTEKLAGQHMSVVVHPDGVVEYLGKGGSRSGGEFSPILTVLRRFHPPVLSSVAYEFEVLKKDVRPDFIHYPLKKDFTVVDLSGEMEDDVAREMSSQQPRVEFVPKSAIRKSVAPTLKDPGARKTLTDYRDALEAGRRRTKSDAQHIESLLMDLIDRGVVPSTLGSSAIEGLFGTTSGGGFKIPTASYAEIQRDQSKFFAVARSVPMDTIKRRFAAAVDNPMADRMVSDVIKYIEKMSTKEPSRGFRTYFSKQEILDLKNLADVYASGDAGAGEELAELFFDRVKDRGSWVATESVDRWRLLAGLLD